MISRGRFFFIASRQVRTRAEAFRVGTTTEMSSSFRDAALVGVLSEILPSQSQCSYLPIAKPAQGAESHQLQAFPLVLNCNLKL